MLYSIGFGVYARACEVRKRESGGGMVPSPLAWTRDMACPQLPAVAVVTIAVVVELVASEAAGGTPR
jgi:hypothetical protein